MIIQTAFNNGDKAWAFVEGHSMELTIGRVRVEVTDSPGIPGESFFSNYRPQKEYVEQYMCVETGVGSGSVYTLGEHIFHTKEECDKANAERIALREAEAEKARAYQREQMLAEEPYLRERLERIEKAKAESATGG